MLVEKLFKKEIFKEDFTLKILFFIQKSAVKTTYFLPYIVLLN